MHLYTVRNKCATNVDVISAKPSYPYLIDKQLIAKLLGQQMNCAKGVIWSRLGLYCTRCHCRAFLYNVGKIYVRDLYLMSKSILAPCLGRNVSLVIKHTYTPFMRQHNKPTRRDRISKQLAKVQILESLFNIFSLQQDKSILFNSLKFHPDNRTEV